MLKKNIKTKKIDGLVFDRKKNAVKNFDFPLARYVLKNKRKSIIISPGGKFSIFSPHQRGEIYLKNKRSLDIKTKKPEAVFFRGEKKSEDISFFSENSSFLRREKLRSWPRKSPPYFFGIEEIFQSFSRQISPLKLWNLSILGAVFLGMFLTSFINKNLGQNVMAVFSPQDSRIQEEIYPSEGGEEYFEDWDINNEINPEHITRIVKNYSERPEMPELYHSQLEKEIREMVKGHPIEKMAGEIARKDRLVAAFLVAIAKKESNWGKRVPVYKGQDCFNYWGYRGIRAKMGTGGHTCFDSPKDAIDTVAKRIEDLISKEKLNTPSKMVVWKCGYDCSWDNKKAVAKWISDVDMYFKKLK